MSRIVLPLQSVTLSEDLTSGALPAADFFWPKDVAPMVFLDSSRED